MPFLNQLRALVRPAGKAAFVRSLPHGARVLDVGCGNESPRYFKVQRSDIYYIGLDVGDYNQHSAQQFANEYIIVTPQRFAEKIAAFGPTLDAVVSSHNLEHCDVPSAVLNSMLRAVKPGGRVYLSFPCEESVGFPRRRGTLNFHDDPTHRLVPDWQQVISTVLENGFSIDMATKRYQPRALRTIGALLEPLSAWREKVLPGTWEWYGFESLIWATRSR